MIFHPSTMSPLCRMVTARSSVIHDQLRRSIGECLCLVGELALAADDRCTERGYVVHVTEVSRDRYLGASAVRIKESQPLHIERTDAGNRCWIVSDQSRSAVGAHARSDDTVPPQDCIGPDHGFG